MWQESSNDCSDNSTSLLINICTLSSYYRDDKNAKSTLYLCMEHKLGLLSKNSERRINAAQTYDLQESRSYIKKYEKNKCISIRTTTSEMWTSQGNKDKESKILGPHQNTLKTILKGSVEGKTVKGR